MNCARLGCWLLLSLTGLVGACSSEGGTDAPLADAPLDATLGEDAPLGDAPGADVPASEDAPMLGDAPPADAAVAATQVIGRQCGPADGFALNLGIFQRAGDACGADPAQQSLTFYIHDLGGAALPPTPGSTVVSAPGSLSNGNATSCPGGSPPCRSSETWSVTFETYEADVSASGSYSVRWSDGTTSTGTFDATWCEAGPVICG